MVKPEVVPGPGPPRATGQLRRLYAQVAQLIALHEANDNPQITLAGDIEVILPQNVKDEIARRIERKTEEVAAMVEALKIG